jgi:AAA family ATP:ADP antiporter
MPERRLYKLLRRFADIRPDEAKRAFYLSLHFFLIVFSIYIIKPVKENFLIGVKPAWWPYADFITAGLIGFVVAFNAKFLRKLPRKSHFSSVTIFFAANLLVWWLLFETYVKSESAHLSGAIPLLLGSIWPAQVFAFCFWSDIFIVVSVTHFWLTVNDTFDLHQAKRTVSLFVTGGLLGGISGSLFTSRLGERIGPANLLLVCPVILVLNLVVINLLYGRRKATRAAEASPAKPSYLNILRTIRQERYLRILTGVFASAMVVGSLINYQFRIAVNSAIANDAERTSFLGSFFLGILLLSAVFHLLATGTILKHFGIRTSLLIGPTALVIGSIAVFLFPPAGLIIWACILRGTDKIFDCTINQSVRELLYMPIPAAIKYDAKLIIDMFVNRLAVGFAAILFWILYRLYSFAEKSPTAQVHQIGIFVVCFALACIVLIWRTCGEYLGTVKSDLTRKWRDAHKVLADHVNLNATRLIVDTLQSREKSSTLYAMNLFQLVQKEELSPDLMAMLSYKEDELKARSMESIIDVPGDVSFREVEEALSDRDIVTMAQEIVALDSYEQVMQKRLEDILGNKNASEEERMGAARLIGLLKPTPAVRQHLDRLLRDSSLEVLNYALDSVAIHRFSEHVPLVIPLLGNPMTRHAAQDALAAYGPGIEDRIKKHLHDATEKLEVRIAMPEILARIGNQKAADILSVELVGETADIEQSLIEALYRIRSNHPEIHFKKKKIISVVLSLMENIYNVYLAVDESRKTGDVSAFTQRWKPALDFKIKQVFDLLALMYPPEDIAKAYQNISQGTQKSVDYSLELLDNVIDRHLKLFLFPIIEDLTPEERIRRLSKLKKGLEKSLAKSHNSAEFKNIRHIS